MKRLVLLILAIFFLNALPAFAEGGLWNPNKPWSVEVLAGFGSEPSNTKWGSASSLGMALNYRFLEGILGLRADASVFYYSPPGVGTLKREPIFIGGRAYFDYLYLEIGYVSNTDFWNSDLNKASSTGMALGGGILWDTGFNSNYFGLAFRDMFLSPSNGGTSSSFYSASLFFGHMW